MWPVGLAKSFRIAETGEEFSYEKNSIEKVGHALRYAIGNIVDITLREIRNPITIVSLTAIAMVAVTIAYYPATVIGIIAKVFPLALKIEPWRLKFALYLSIQMTILGVGIRALGRFANPSFIEKWKTGDLEPVYIGDRKV